LSYLVPGLRLERVVPDDTATPGCMGSLRMLVIEDDTDAPYGVSIPAIS
jgi:hypothetical protein